MPVSLDEIRGAPKVLLHDHLDGGLRPATIIELAAETGYRACPRPTPAELARWLTGEAPTRDLERYLETFPHTVAVMQTAGRADPGRRRVRRGPGRRRRRLRRGALRARAAHRAGLEPGPGRRGGARGVPARQPRGRGIDRRRAAHRDAAPRRGPWRSPSSRCATATRASSASTSPAPRRATRPPGTSTRSSTCSGRTSTSPSTPARRSACRRSGRRCSGAAPSGSGTACGSSTTSRSRPDGTAKLGRLAAYVRDKPDPAGDVPDLERADRRGAVDRRAPDRAAAPAAVPGDGQHRQPADERRHAVLGVRTAGRGVRLRLGATSSG